MVGKDILRFHAVYWPAFLMAADLDPPKRVFAHGWWTNEGEKISKSLGNIIDPLEIIAQYGLDQVRYFLLREVPFGNDGDFSRRAMVGRINGDLANDLGNLAQRVLSMINKNCDGAVPDPASGLQGGTKWQVLAVLAHAHELLDEVRPIIDRQAFHDALEAAWRVIREANRCVDADAPWTLRKENPDGMRAVLYVLAETIRHLAIVLWPFMPDACDRLLDQLAVAQDRRDFAALNPGSSITDDNSLRPGTVLPVPQGVFPRVVGDDAGNGEGRKR
jgi:methionyl-tRNA synthetase